MGRCKFVAKAVLGFVHKCTSKTSKLDKIFSSHGTQAFQQAEMDSAEAREEPNKPSIALEHDVAVEIGRALMNSRSRDENKGRVTASIDALEDIWLEIHTYVFELETAVLNLKLSKAKGAKLNAERMRQDASKLREWMKKLEQEQSHLNEELQHLRQAEERDHAEVFAAVKDVFVGLNVLPQAESTGQGLVATTLALLEAVESLPVPMLDEVPLSDAPGSEHSEAHTSQASGPIAEAEKAASKVKADELDNLKRDYCILKGFYHQAEADFDMRYHYFDKERIEHEMANPHSALSLDMHQLKETQRLTRDLIEAEMEYQEAKEKALAAGCNLQDSDLSSGFVDDVEDGYRVSYEREVQEAINKGAMDKWLEGIQTIDGEEASSDWVLKPGSAEVDDWDANSIDIQDSRSLVAEGHSRRLIDKWRGIVALVVAK